MCSCKKHEVRAGKYISESFLTIIGRRKSGRTFKSPTNTFTIHSDDERRPTSFYPRQTHWPDPYNRTINDVRRNAITSHRILRSPRIESSRHGIETRNHHNMASRWSCNHCTPAPMTLLMFRNLLRY